ncbi:hepatocyte growth factor activator-like [Montipora foliosa]|uniref:hepatocyte growth factor activator-like n=1 Tax=Montipora foliosa TaxID=591990 RepID=UPI0035F1E38E
MLLIYTLLVFSTVNLIAVDSNCPPGKKTTDRMGRCCVFPFIYWGKRHYSCITGLDQQPWCLLHKYFAFEWAYCVDECASSPCKNGASCKTTNDTEVGYSCQPCLEGWQGQNCDEVSYGSGEGIGL